MENGDKSHMELSYCDNWREASEEKYSEDALEVGNVEKETEAVVGEEVAITSSTTSGGARGELLGYAGGQCHLHGGGVVVDEVAGGLHGHPAEKIRPGFGQLVDV